jgi:hypothetical protein
LPLPLCSRFGREDPILTHNGRVLFELSPEFDRHRCVSNLATLQLRSDRNQPLPV